MDSTIALFYGLYRIPKRNNGRHYGLIITLGTSVCSAKRDQYHRLSHVRFIFSLDLLHCPQQHSNTLSSLPSNPHAYGAIPINMDVGGELMLSSFAVASVCTNEQGNRARCSFNAVVLSCYSALCRGVYASRCTSSCEPFTGTHTTDAPGDLFFDLHNVVVYPAQWSDCINHPSS